MGYFASTFLTYFSIFWILILAIFLVGHITIIPFKQQTEKSFFTFFYKIFTGTIMLVSTYSVIVTHFKTINIVLILIAVFFIIRVKPNWKGYSIEKVKTTGISKQQAVIIFITGTVIFSYIAFFKIPASENLIPAFFFDTVFYSKITEYLNISGFENTFQEANITDADFHGAATYHYFELWITAFTVRIFGTLTLLSFEVITVPFLVFASFVGFLSLLESVKKIVWYDLLIIFSFLFLSGIYLPQYEKYDFIRLLGPTYVFPMLGYFASPKVLVQVFFVLISLNLIKRGRNDIAFFPLLCLPVLNIALVPSVFAGLVLVNLTAYFTSLSIRKENIISNILQVFLVFFAIGVFYVINKPNLNYMGNLNIAEIIKYNIVNLFPSKLNYLAGILIANVAYYFPFLILMIVFIKPLYRFIKNNIEAKLLLILLLLLIAVSLFTILFLSGLPDFYQFYSNIFLTIIYVLFFMIYVFLAESNNKYKAVFLFLIILISLYNFRIDFNARKDSYFTNYYSTAYIEKIREILPEIKNPVGVCLFSKDNDEIYGKPTHNSLGFYLKLMKNNFNTVNLSTYHLYQTMTIPQYKILLKSKTFNYYALKEIQKNSQSISEHKQMQSFIEEYKINYLIKHKDDTLPGFFLPLIKEKITDSKTGETFYLLNN